MTSDSDEWVSDANGNRCSVSYFGSREAAQAALDSLKNCERCENCSRCSGCSDCSDCSRCSRCSDCSDCSHIAYLDNKTNVVVEGDSDNITHLGCPDVPRIENIHQAVYAAVSQPRALDMSAWHTCETTHCRAGWVVTLAGEAGKRLEEFHNAELAATLIYAASGYLINPARFYDNNIEAMEDMRRLAESA